MSLADSMGKSPETFPRVYTAMVQAGETGGFLDLVLAQIADFQAREKELRSKVMSAMLYPTILFCLAIGVLIFLLTFFIPRFQGIFKGFGATLPHGDADRDRDEQRGEKLWRICSGGPGHCRFLAPDLVHVGEGPADMGGPGAESASPGATWWPSSPWPGSAGCWARSWARACRWCRA